MPASWARIQEMLLLTLVGAVPLVADPASRTVDAQAFEAIRLAVGGSIASAFIGLEIARRILAGDRFRGGPLTLPLAAVAMAMSVASLRGAYVSPLHVAMPLGWTGLVAAMLGYFDSYRRVRHAGYALLVGGLLSAGYGVVQYAGRDPWFFPLRDTVTGQWLPHGSFGSPSLLAWYLAAVLPLALFVVVHHRYGFMRLCGVSGVIFMLTVIALTRTRTVLAALAGGLIVAGAAALWRRPPVLRKNLSLLGGLAVGVALVLFPLLRRNPEIPRGVANAGSFLNRTGDHLLLWRAAAKVALLSAPWGVGEGGFASRYPLTAPASTDPLPPLYRDIHNEYLALASEAGVPGVLAIFWLAMAALKRCLRRLGEHGLESGHSLVAATMLGCLFLAMEAAVTFPSRSIPAIVLFAAFLGILGGRWSAAPGSTAS